jgi:hypothetical protein
VRCPDELSLANGVQLSILRLEGAQSSSSSSGIESCRSECPGWLIAVLDMHGMVCVRWRWCMTLPRSKSKALQKREFNSQTFENGILFNHPCPQMGLFSSFFCVFGEGLIQALVLKKGGVLFELVQIPRGFGRSSLDRQSGTVLYGSKQKGVCWINRKFPVGEL